LLASVLAALGSGIALLYVVLQQVFSTNPQLKTVGNLDFGHYLAVLVVALVVGFYHWRVLRADSAARPARHENAPAPMTAAAVAPAISAPTVDPTPVPVAAPAGMRFILSVVDATEDDVHQVLANLPPAASYLLTPLEPES
jgi:hypothetical protein